MAVRALLPPVKAAVQSCSPAAAGLLASARIALLELPYNKAAAPTAPSEEELAVSRALGARGRASCGRPPPSPPPPLSPSLFPPLSRASRRQAR